MFTKNRHTPTVISISFRVTLCATKDLWLTLCWRKQTSFRQRIKDGKKRRVKAVLRDNNYPMSFTQKCERALTEQSAENNFNGFVVLLYLQGISEKIGRILKQKTVKVTCKPQLTINSPFPLPKERDNSDRQKSGIILFYGQTERSLKSRIAEHKKAVVGFDEKTKVASHVYHFSHNMNFENVKVIGFEDNYHERLFLDARHSTLDPNAGNDHIVLPEAYKGIARAWITWLRAQASRWVTFIAYDNELRVHITDGKLKHEQKRLLKNIKRQWQTFFHRTYLCMIPYETWCIPQLIYRRH